MKHHHSPRGGRLLTGLLAALLSTGSTFAADEIPTGTLNVDRSLVRIGSRSQLSWQIQHPVGVTEVVEILPPNIIKPKKNLKMRVRVLGASFQQSLTSYLPVEVMWSKNNSSWSRIFYGTQLTVNPSSVVLDTTVKTNDKINFGGRGYRSGWLPLYDTAENTPNLIMLQTATSCRPPPRRSSKGPSRPSCAPTSRRIGRPSPSGIAI